MQVDESGSPCRSPETASGLVHEGRCLGSMGKPDGSSGGLEGALLATGAGGGRSAAPFELSFTHISLLTEVHIVINLAAIFNNTVHLFELSNELNENTITV